MSTQTRVVIFGTAVAFTVSTLNVVVFLFLNAADPIKIEYFCSSSEVQYLQTSKGISVHYDTYGVPVPCK